MALEKTGDQGHVGVERTQITMSAPLDNDHFGIRSRRRELLEASDRNHLIGIAVHQHDGGLHGEDRVTGGEVVETVSNEPLDIAEKQIEKWRGDAVHLLPHHLPGMREGGDRHHCGEPITSGSAEDGGAGPDGVSDDTDGGHIRTSVEPFGGDIEILGEPGHRHETVVLGETVVAGIEGKRVDFGAVKMWCHRKHQGSVPTPTVEDGDSRRGAINWDEPAVESGAIDTAKPDLLFGQAKIGG
jgi:hypothetical protein